MPQTPYRLALNRAGVWEVRWTEKTRGQRSASRTWSTGESERAQADAKAQEFWRTQEAIERHLSGPKTGKCLLAYLDSAEGGRGVGPTQRWSLKPVIEALGDLHVEEITPEDVMAYRRKRLSAGIAEGTIRRELGALVAALNWSARARLIARHEVPYVELPPPSQPRQVWLTREQERDLWSRALAELNPDGTLSRIARYVPISLATAARAEAVMDLTWERVDFHLGLLDFRVPGRRLVAKRRTIVPIADRLRPVLERADRERRSKGVPDTEFVVGNGSIRTAWSTWLCRTPYGFVHPHDLRRTWASLAVQAGAAIYEVAAVLGDDVATVERHYGFLAPGHLKSAVNAV